MCKPFTKYEQVENLVLISFQDKKRKLRSLYLSKFSTLHWSYLLLLVVCQFDFPVNDFDLKKDIFFHKSTETIESSK